MATAKQRELRYSRRGKHQEVTKKTPEELALRRARVATLGSPVPPQVRRAVANEQRKQSRVKRRITAHIEPKPLPKKPIQRPSFKYRANKRFQQVKRWGRRGNR